MGCGSSKSKRSRTENVNPKFGGEKSFVGSEIAPGKQEESGERDGLAVHVAEHKHVPGTKFKWEV